MPQKQLWRQLRGQRAVQPIPRAIFWHMSSKKETTRTRKPTAKSVKHHCHTHTEFFWEQFGNVAWWRTLGELTVVVQKITAICDFCIADAGKTAPAQSFTMRTKCSCWLSFPPLLSPCERSGRAGFRFPPAPAMQPGLRYNKKLFGGNNRYSSQTSNLCISVECCWRATAQIHANLVVRKFGCALDSGSPQTWNLAGTLIWWYKRVLAASPSTYRGLKWQGPDTYVGSIETQRERPW